MENVPFALSIEDVTEEEIEDIVKEAGKNTEKHNGKIKVGMENSNT